MKLDEVAKIIVGQIMTRVSAENKNENDTIGIVKVLVPKAISDGIIVKEDLGELQICKMIDEKKFTREGDVVVKLSTPYDATYVTKENEGWAVPSFCAIIRVKKDEMDAKYLSAFLNTRYVREILKSKVMGSIRPMIKVTDLRNLDIPQVSKEDMEDIGQAYILSGKKKIILSDMIETETKIMENVVLKSIKKGMENEEARNQ